MKTDIFRYCLMADRGGFYFDISKGCTVPLRTLCGPDAEALIAFEPHPSPIPCPAEVAPHLRHPDKLLLQWGFSFAPGHRSPPDDRQHLRRLPALPRQGLRLPQGRHP
jgi:hypothetical protein